jgi:hypothetical protein
MSGIGDLAGLSAPLTKLVESVEKAIGATLGPWQTRRMAKAEAEASITHARAEGETRLILAGADIETEDLRRRTAQRLIHREVQRQANIEAIVTAASDHLPPHVSPEPVDDDWITDFLERCKDVSNHDMKQLWAKILAGEVATPGSFSPRTLHAMKLLSQQDAKIFKLYSSFLFGGDFAPPVRIPCDNDTNTFLLEKGLPPLALSHLKQLGFVESSAGLSSQDLDGIRITCSGDAFRLAANTKRTFLFVEHLTQTGAEIASVIDIPRNPQYLDFIRQHLSRKHAITLLDEST